VTREARIIALISSSAKRTGTIFPFAFPFGSLGLPTFLAFFCRSNARLLNDEGSYSVVQDRYMPARILIGAAYVSHVYYCITIMYACQEFLCYDICGIQPNARIAIPNMAARQMAISANTTSPEGEKVPDIQSLARQA
jgi:hypothetical protein